MGGYEPQWYDSVFIATMRWEKVTNFGTCDVRELDSNEKYSVNRQTQQYFPFYGNERKNNPYNHTFLPDKSPALYPEQREQRTAPSSG